MGEQLKYLTTIKIATVEITSTCYIFFYMLRMLNKPRNVGKSGVYTIPHMQYTVSDAMNKLMHGLPLAFPR